MNTNGLVAPAGAHGARDFPCFDTVPRLCSGCCTPCYSLHALGCVYVPVPPSALASLCSPPPSALTSLCSHLPPLWVCVTRGVSPVVCHPWCVTCGVCVTR
jgi:hypothetical protein